MGPVPPHRTGRPIRIITKKGCQGAGADPPRRGASAGHGGAGALSRHPGHHRPAIEDGFYYDFARDEPFTPEDLPKIEAKMREIVKQADLRPAAKSGRATRRSRISGMGEPTRPN
jgi:hypothetical protein